MTPFLNYTEFFSVRDREKFKNYEHSTIDMISLLENAGYEICDLSRLKISTISIHRNDRRKDKLILSFRFRKNNEIFAAMCYKSGWAIKLGSSCKYAGGQLNYDHFYFSDKVYYGSDNDSDKIKKVSQIECFSIFEKNISEALHKTKEILTVKFTQGIGLHSETKPTGSGTFYEDCTKQLQQMKEGNKVILFEDYTTMSQNPGASSLENLPTEGMKSEDEDEADPQGKNVIPEGGNTEADISVGPNDLNPHSPLKVSHKAGDEELTLDDIGDFADLPEDQRIPLDTKGEEHHQPLKMAAEGNSVLYFDEFKKK